MIAAVAGNVPEAYRHGGRNLLPMIENTRAAARHCASLRSSGQTRSFSTRPTSSRPVSWRPPLLPTSRKHCNAGSTILDGSAEGSLSHGEDTRHLSTSVESP